MKIKSKEDERVSFLKSPFTLTLFIVVALYCSLLLLLIIWGVSTSLKSVDEFMDNPVWLPRKNFFKWEWRNFVYLLQNFKVQILSNKGMRDVWIEEMAVYSVLYAGVGSLVSIICPCWVAYLVERFDFKFSKIYYNFILIIMIIPLQGTSASMLSLYKMLHIFDTFTGLYMMKFNATGINFLIFYAAYRSIPKDFEEAAKIDGASELSIFTRILFPMVGSTFITLYLLAFIASWNDYMTPLIYLPTHPTVAYGVYQLNQTNLQGFSRTPMRLATCYIMVIPMLTLFFLFRKKIMGNIAIGGVKG